MSQKKRSRGEQNIPAEGTLGRRIFDRRRELFMTQDALAKQVGVTQSAVARWERNADTPKLSIREKLAAVLRTYPHTLFADVAAAEAGERADSEAATA